MAEASKFKFYRSKHNGLIRPAYSHNPGYEDQHPEDWEGYNSLEDAREAQGKLDEVTRAAIEGRVEHPNLEPLPHSLTLQPEDVADVVATQKSFDPSSLMGGIIPPPPPTTKV